MMRPTRPWALGALAGCCVAACSMIGHQVFAQTPFDSQVAADGEALVECLKAKDRPLAVLFLVDDSASLLSRDPENSRVPALQAALTSLGLVAETRAVYLDIYRFGTDVVRAFDDVKSWAQLDAGLRIDLEERVEEFAAWQVARDTDYASALLRSIQVLPDAPAGACRLIVWFTDGQLDFEYEGTPKPREWTDFVIESWDDARAATLRAEDAICGKNGLIDQLRSEDLTTDGAFIAAIALGDPEGDDEFALLERVVTNRNEDCGERPAKGTVARTFDVAGLTGLLVRAVDPAPPGAKANVVALAENECAAPLDPSAPGAFTVPSSLASMRARLESSHPNVRAVVVAPEEIGGSRIIDLARDVELSSASGLQVRVAAFSDRLSGVILEFPAQLGAWASEWELRFCTADPSLVGSTGVVEVLSVTGEARAEIVEGVTLRRGRSGTVSAQLIGRGGDPIGGDALGRAQPLLKVTGAELGPIELDPAGRARSSVNIPEDFVSDELIVNATLEPDVEVFPPDHFWKLTPWDGELAALKVQDLPRYPLVELPGSFGVLDQENLVGVAAIPIVADGEESAGCLMLERATFEELPDGAGRLSVRVLDGERVITPGDPCPIRLEAGEERELVVEVEASLEQARLAGLRSGELVMRSTSDIDDEQSEVFTYPLEVRVRPLVVVEDPSAELLLLYFVLAALAPVALLYAYNIFWGARLDVVSTPLVVIPVSYDGRSLRRRDQSDGTGVLTVGADDVRPWGQSSGRPRRLSGRLPDGEELRLRARASWLPWGQPYATSEIGAHRLQLGPLGRLRRAGTGHIGLSTSGLWVAGMTPIANKLGRLAAQGTQDSDGPSWDGVIAVLPGMGVGSDVVSRADHIVAAAHETISLVLESDEAQRIAHEDAGDDAADSQSSDGAPLADEPSDQDDLPGARPGRRGAKGSFDDPPSGPGRRDPGSDGLPTSDGPFGRGSPGSSSWPTSGGDGLPQ